MKKTFAILTLLFITISLSLKADIKLPNIFSDNMVMQRDQPLKIWGWADKNENIEVRFLNQTKKTKANKDGYWSVVLAPVAYGGPYILSIKGKKDALVLNDILVGDVWLASGQSNMEWIVANSNNAETEINNANYPQIRAFNVKRDLSSAPLDNLSGEWKICSPETVGSFSAVAYYFARKLNEDLNIPIGIINSSWGGTDIETWTSSDTFNTLPNIYKDRYKDVPTNIFNNFEESAAKNNENKQKYLEALNSDLGLQEKWYLPSTNISSWNTMQIPQFWENVLGNVDGIIWFRYHLVLSAADANKPGKIHLGPIDDWDTTWINGVEVGKTSDHIIEREYNIPQDILKEGDNVIVVKVTDTGGGGGFYGKKEQMYLEVGKNRYPLHGEWSYKEAVTNKQFDYQEIFPNLYYSLLYNAMINPITDYKIKGAIWYQGESNADQAYNYRTLFPLMINDWRTKWNYEFPFYWVQLANFMAKDDTPRDSNWAELREAQTMTLSLPQTGQAVITDIGEANDIHPRNKQDVGLRLALIALNKDYGKQDIVYSGPEFQSMEIDGSKAIITFHNADGLYTKSKYGYVEGFAVSGADNKWEWAKAYLENGKVIVYSDYVSNPGAVRYSWSDNPDVNLFNKAGLPAVPFRTDKQD